MLGLLPGIALAIGLSPANAAGDHAKRFGAVPLSSMLVGTKYSRPPGAVELCGRLSEIKHIPFEDEDVDDAVYNQIMAKGQTVVPCLIDQLASRTRMADPRSEPTVDDFRVGDLAFFLLLRLTRVSFEEPLPQRVRAKLKDQGVYAYFEYTETPANRAALQRWWRSWLGRRPQQHE